MKILIIKTSAAAGAGERAGVHGGPTLERLVSNLRADGHEAQLIAVRRQPELDALFLRELPDLVGISAGPGRAASARSIAARLKALCPDCWVLAGGHGWSVRARELNDPHIDLVAVGEGVSRIREIAMNLVSGIPLKEIPGLALTGMEMEFSDPQPCAG